ncbi:MAG: restriction endonuclease subunit S [Muribaculaceae bacterium]|nr:restriction endonuclease subunit S [Muribaculaceae bacterium]
MKYVAIKDIVHSVSQTHKFEKDHLKAVNTSDVLGGVLFDVPYSETALLKGQFKKTIRFNDILFSEIRPANRRFARVNIKETADYVVSTKLMVLRKFNDSVDLDYFYYCLTNQSFLETLQRRAENRIGSFPQITFDLLGEYKFPIPTLDEQKRIASVIANIDSKINVNREINRNLEAMARQLYDYWFVQFDFPDENGRPYKTSGGKMVWNEKLKRDIPEGWEDRRLDSLAKIFTGKKDVSKVISGPYKFFSCAPDPIPSNEYIYDGDVILVSGNGSYTGRVMFYSGKVDLYQRTYACSGIDESNMPFLYCTIKTLFEPYHSGGKHGSSIPYIVLEDLAGFRFAYHKETVEKFVDLINPVFYKFIFKEDDENTLLVNTRDNLLPLLMNGQVSVMPPEVNCDLSRD